MRNSPEVFSYIDPGTGSVIVGSLWGVLSTIFVAVFAFIVAYFIRPLKKIMKKKIVKLILIVIIITIAGYLLAYSYLDYGVDVKEKVILIGIDAMDPKVSEKLMSDGKLPNFKKLATAGFFSELATTIPPETPVAWSAAATGTNPGKYGIFDFLRRDPKTYEITLSLIHEKSGIMGTGYESLLRGTPFWQITSENRIPTSVIKWPVTFPPSKVNGKMLSGLGTVDIKGLLNSYTFYTSGDEKSGPMDAGKIVKVEKNKSNIETKLFGPRVRSGNDISESETDMKIEIASDLATITVDGSKYMFSVNEWSDWIKVKFKIDFLNQVNGIFKAYLISTEPEFKMYITSIQIDPERPLYDISYPKEYSSELTSKIGTFYTMGIPEDTKAVTEGRISKKVFFEQVKQIEDEREKMFWYELSNFDTGILAFGFDSGDRLQHIMWQKDSVPKEIEEYYVQKDEFLGKLLKRIDNDTKVLIFSDHGFNSFERAVSINTWLYENGYISLTKEPTEEDSGNLFEYVDWNKTSVYSLGFTSIFINLKEREGKGIVEKEKKEILIDEIIAKLKQLKDPKTGKKVITELYKGSEVYSGKYAEESPDIVIGFEPGYRMSWQNAVGGFSPDIIFDNDQEWKGDHLVDRSHVPGVVFSNFAIRKDNPEIIDIAPTVLNLLNIDVPENMDGKTLVLL